MLLRTTATCFLLAAAPIASVGDRGNNNRDDENIFSQGRGQELVSQGRGDDDYGNRTDFDGRGHDHSHNGGNDGGRGGRGHSGYSSLFDIDVYNITCSDDYTCDVGRRGRNSQNGTYVCRTSYDQITGVMSTNALCIEMDEAWSTDECGCCGADCPTDPVYIEMTCDSTNSTSRFLKETSSRNSGGNDSRGGRDSSDSDDRGGNDNDNRGGKGDKRDDDDEIVVCRNLFNIYTGEETPMTITIDSDKGLEGDVCGCCDDTCPEDGESSFESPEYVDASCAAEEVVTCDISHKKRGGNETEGLYLCRTTFDKITGESEKKTVCAASDEAWESDECGCCDGTCPDESKSVDIECSEEQTCERTNGKTGVFVCRSAYNPVDGDLEEISLCISSDDAWSTDLCGCCEESGCPDTPEEGFEDEETQIASLALETTEEQAVTTEGSSGVSTTASSMGALSFIALVAVAFAL